jgi:hypothetical protein
VSRPDPPPPRGLPRQRRGVTPQGRGRYPDYDVLANAHHWDAVTRGVVEKRARTTPELSFFTADEAHTLRAFCDTVTGQDSEPRIPVVEMVDAKLAARSFDGYRYADMPRDDETWRRVARALDGFADLDAGAREQVVQSFAEGKLACDGLDASKAWSVVTRGVLSSFYSHPWAWSEIGYGGPRYPRGYIRMGSDRAEPDGAREGFELDPVKDVARRS